MSGIHGLVMERIQTYLAEHLNDGLQPGDREWVTLVKNGPLQGDPDPDEARIFITIFENDPDGFVSGVVTSLSGGWTDEILDTEIGLEDDRVITTWVRKFTLKARLLLEQTRENEYEARNAASGIRTRIEHLLPKVPFSDLKADGEYVSKRISGNDTQGEMIGAGGPPDSYDFMIKIRFSLWTTTGK